MKNQGRRDFWLIFWVVIVLINAAIVAARFINN